MAEFDNLTDNELLDALDAERSKFTASDVVRMRLMVNELVQRGVLRTQSRFRRRHHPQGLRAAQESLMKNRSAMLGATRRGREPTWQVGATVMDRHSVARGVVMAIDLSGEVKVAWDHRPDKLEKWSKKDLVLL